jgi:hypothetical protein
LLPAPADIERHPQAPARCNWNTRPRAGFFVVFFSKGTGMPMQPKEKVMTLQKGQSGIPAGRPRGSRNRATELGYSLLEKELAMVMSKVIELASAGNTAALKMYVNRMVTIQRGSCELPPFIDPMDSLRAMAAIAEAVADGELAPSEAWES